MVLRDWADINEVLNEFYNPFASLIDYHLELISENIFELSYQYLKPSYNLMAFVFYLLSFASQLLKSILWINLTYVLI